MTKAFERRLKSKNVKTSSKTVRVHFPERPSPQRCAVTGKKLAGVCHEAKGQSNKQSKTQRRPSTPFGGILSGEAREQVFLEFGKVTAGVKGINDVDAKYRDYVKQAMKKN